MYTLTLSLSLSLYLSISIYLSIYLHISLSISLSIYLSIHLPISLSVLFSFLTGCPTAKPRSRGARSLYRFCYGEEFVHLNHLYLSIYLSIFLSICLSVYLSSYLPIFVSVSFHRTLSYRIWKPRHVKPLSPLLWRASGSAGCRQRRTASIYASKTDLRLKLVSTNKWR